MQDENEKKVQISEISLRIKEIISHFELSDSKFASIIEVGKGRLSNVLNGRNKPDIEFVTIIVKKFRNVNASWLLTGEGKMILYNLDTPQEDLSKSLTYTSKSQELATHPLSSSEEHLKLNNEVFITEIKKLTIENYLLKEELEKTREKLKQLSVNRPVLVE